MAKIKTPPKSHLFRYRHKPRGVSANKFEKTFWPYLPLLIALGSTLLLGFRGGAINTNPGSHVLGYASSMQVDKLIADTNNARNTTGLAPLKLNTQLDSAAQAKAENMAKLDYWSHTVPGKKPPWVFVAAQHYNYQILGENLATGFDNEQSVLNAWMASAEHRANILNPKFTQAGFGVAQSSDFKAAGGGPMTIVVAYYAEPVPQIRYAIAKAPKFYSASANESTNTSHAQLALAGTRWSSAGSLFVAGLILISAGIILGRHGLAIRRSFKRGERFIAKHPLIDLGLIGIIFISYLLLQTAGLIK